MPWTSGSPLRARARRSPWRPASAPRVRTSAASRYRRRSAAHRALAVAGAGAGRPNTRPRPPSAATSIRSIRSSRSTSIRTSFAPTNSCVVSSTASSLDAARRRARRSSFFSICRTITPQARGRACRRPALRSPTTISPSTARVAEALSLQPPQGRHGDLRGRGRRPKRRGPRRRPSIDSAGHQQVLQAARRRATVRGPPLSIRPWAWSIAMEDPTLACFLRDLFDAHAPVSAPLFAGPGTQPPFVADDRNSGRAGLLYEQNTAASSRAGKEISRPRLHQTGRSRRRCAERDPVGRRGPQRRGQAAGPQRTPRRPTSSVVGAILVRFLVLLGAGPLLGV